MTLLGNIDDWDDYIVRPRSRRDGHHDIVVIELLEVFIGFTICFIITLLALLPGYLTLGALQGANMQSKKPRASRTQKRI